MLGIWEFSNGWQSNLTVQTTVRAGARTGSGLGNDRAADYAVLQAVKAGMTDFSTSDIQTVIVYKAAAANGEPPAGCVTGTSSSSLLCNVYTGTELNTLTLGAFTGTAATGCTGTSPDRFWCPTTRSVSRRTPSTSASTSVPCPATRPGSSPEPVSLWRRTWSCGSSQRPRRDRRGPHSRSPPPGPGADHKDREPGYTMIMTAFLVVPLLAFAGLAVDVGGWYARGAQLQRAADEAALAGATMMPDFPAAQAEAVTTTRKNGFVSGGSISITVSQKDERRIGVAIKDSNVTPRLLVPVHLGLSIERSATAEFVLPVPIGSPENYFGNDPVNPPPAGQPGLWGNIHGISTTNISGDRYAAAAVRTPGARQPRTSSAGARTTTRSTSRRGRDRSTSRPTTPGSTAGAATSRSRRPPALQHGRYHDHLEVRGPDKTLLDWQDYGVPATCPATVSPTTTPRPPTRTRGPRSARSALKQSPGATGSTSDEWARQRREPLCAAGHLDRRPETDLSAYRA